jgi:putative PIN family toxin of toxin-antitoxin system
LRVVLDVNVLISALLSKTGAPAQLLARWLAGQFELVVCESLLAETQRTLERRKLRGRIPEEDAAQFVVLLRELGEGVPDPKEPPPVHSSDPGDDYLLALAAREDVLLVSGDRHLLALRDRAPVLAPSEFLARLEAG